MQLDVTTQPEGRLRAGSRQLQRQAIAARQDALTRELAGVPHRAQRRFRGVPFVALEVGPAALAALERSAWLDETDQLTPVSISPPQIIDGSKIRELQIGSVIVGVPEPPASLVDLVADADLTNEHIKTACIELIKSEGWGDQVVKTRTPTPNNYEVQHKPRGITQRGIVENELSIDKKNFVALLEQAEPVSEPASALRQILMELHSSPPGRG